jgi:hypothetical protein
MLARFRILNITLFMISRIMSKDEVVKGTKGRWKSSLQFQGKFRGMCENSEVSLENSINSFNDIAHLGMPQVEQLLFILRPVQPLNSVELTKLKRLTEDLHGPIQRDDSVHLDRVSREIRILGNLHQQDSISQGESEDQ